MAKELMKTKSKLLKKNDLPKHLAIIMDGNGRWAERKGLPRSFGHQEGLKTVKRVINCCLELNIPILTLYAFSTENWKRPQNEISFILELFYETLHEEKENLVKNNIQVNFIGRIEELPEKLINRMFELTELTKNNHKLILNIAINYGGRAEIIDAMKSIALLIKKHRVKMEEINEEIISSNLYTHKLPDPDLLIRTAGEMRISNFMIWQIAYTEFWVTPVCWPDFNQENLVEALIDYQKRERRFGGRS